ncbi:MAG: signal peptidase I [bacterium]|nr:signal peptidase I [bacterium]
MRSRDGASWTGSTDYRTPRTPADPDPDADEAGPSHSVYRHGRDRPRVFRFFRELPGVLLLALVLAVVIKTFLLQAFFIPSSSMLPTFEIDDRVLVSKIAYRLSGPQPGDLIVFDSPFASDSPQEPLWERGVRNVLESVGVRTAQVEDLIKRVIAVGGDRLEIRGNRVLVNGIPLDEPYLAAGYRMRDMAAFYVPAGHVWVMGDNRDNSQDSRRFGPVPSEDVVGRAFVRIWPLTRWEGL